MKIAPNELRIGNWVYQTIEETYEYQVKADDFAENLTKVYHAPIPLAEEWLVKFGFEKVSSHFEIGEDIRRYALYINSTGNGFTCQLLRTFNGVHTITNFATDMLYVHQLQNLYFALTGKELTIKH